MTDPKRLIDPESRSSPTLRTLLRAARSELPTEERIEVIGARMGLWLGPAAGGAPHGSSVAPGVSAAGAGLKMGAAKIGAVAVLALGGVGASYVLATGPRATMVHALAPAVASGPAPTSAPAAPSPLLNAPSEEPRAAPEPSPAPVPGPAVGGPPGAVPTGDTEVSLLESAQDALASSPESALSLAERHATRFPHGSLAQEREVIAIEALLRLGRGDAARVRADRFYRAFPRSAHRARIENLLNADSSHNP